ncbi:MAG: HAD hydrolase family protein [Myxococcota bacterium]|nr:HAD hydrolase family protein [Myxococcota bacterium]
MKPLSALTVEELRKLRGLAFDLDDTFLDHGRLVTAALDALYRLKSAGFELFVVTGRPASWGAIATHQWPIDGAVTENGAIGFFRDGARVRGFDRLLPEEREGRRAELARRVLELRQKLPELVPADDVSGRISDFTFDIGEYQKLPRDAVLTAKRAAEALGLAVMTSSVHLHVSLDRADKASGFLRFVSDRFGIEPTRARASYAFIGDSDNDAACFAAFRVTIGVANLSGRQTVPPRYRTLGARADGFVEAANVLLARDA